MQLSHRGSRGAPVQHSPELLQPQTTVRRVKIAVIAHLKYPIGQPYAGGLEMHTHLMTRELRRRGHDVTLFASEGSDPDLATVVCPPTGEDLGDAERWAAIEAAEHAAYRGILDAVAAGGFDLVHNNSLHALPLRESGLFDIPWVTVLHTPPFDSLVGGIEAARPDMRYLAVSQTLAREWTDLIPGLDVVPNGIDLTTFPYSADPDPQAYAFWFGRIVPEKGLHLAIDAAREAGFRLVFAGPKLNPAYWESEIAPRLGPDLQHLGHLSHHDLAAHLGRARVAVVTPRWEEPFGLVVAEAIACGTPVAAFRRGAMPEILDASCGRLADADDASDLARAIRGAATLSRRACRDRVEAHFDAAVMTARYEAVYAEMLAEQAAPRLILSAAE